MMDVELAADIGSASRKDLGCSSEFITLATTIMLEKQLKTPKSAAEALQMFKDLTEAIQNI